MLTIITKILYPYDDDDDNDDINDYNRNNYILSKKDIWFIRHTKK